MCPSNPSFVTTRPAVQVVFCQGTFMQPSRLECWVLMVEPTSKMHPVGTEVSQLTTHCKHPSIVDQDMQWSLLPQGRKPPH